MIMAGAGDDPVLKKMLYLYLGTYAAQKVSVAAEGWRKALCKHSRYQTLPRDNTAGLLLALL